MKRSGNNLTLWLVAACLHLGNHCAAFAAQDADPNRSAESGENDLHVDAKSYQSHLAKCELGDAYSCGYAGLYHVERNDFQEGLVYFSRACGSDFGSACSSLGIVLLELDRHADALESFIKGCELGHGGGCFEAARMESAGNEPDADHPWVVKACQLQDGPSCLLVGDHQKQKGRIEKALVSYRRACWAKHGRGCSRAGDIFFEKDQFPEAANLYERACKYGYPVGCVEAGYAYLELEDKDKSLKFFKTGCESFGGTGIACIPLGEAQQHFLPDLNVGRETIRKACQEDGSPECIEALTEYRERKGSAGN